MDYLPELPRILVVDDEKGVLEFVVAALSQIYEVDGEISAVKAVEVLAAGAHQMLITDLMMPEMSGIELMRAAKENNHAIVCMAMTGYADKDNAIAALQAGAYDLLEKPLLFGLLMESVDRTWRGFRAEMENYTLISELRRVELTARHLGQHQGLPLDTVYQAPAMKQACEVADRHADSMAPVLVIGELGSGLSWMARRIHSLSSRARGPFIEVTCGGKLREGWGLFDLEVLVEAAVGGTLLLNGVTQLPAEAQDRLIRIIDSGDPDVRVMVATHDELAVAGAVSGISADLRARVSEQHVKVPPLRERTADIPFLAGQIVEMLAARYEKRTMILDAEVFVRLSKHPWPANIVELQNVLERGVLLGGTEVELAHLPAEFQHA